MEITEIYDKIPILFIYKKKLVNFCKNKKKIGYIYFKIIRLFIALGLIDNSYTYIKTYIYIYLYICVYIYIYIYNRVSARFARRTLALR